MVINNKPSNSISLFLKKLSVLLLIVFFVTKFSVAEEINNNEHQLNFYTGNFDFSDDKQKAILVGFQHQNENLFSNDL